MTYKELYETLANNNGISRIWIKVLEMLDCDYDYSDSSLQLICLYFSFLDDGNTCISLNSDKLWEKWEKKWEGLITEKENKEESNNQNPLTVEDLKASINDIIKLNEGKKLTGLFVIDNDWLYAKKYYDAKLDIQKKFSVLFPGNRQSWTENTPYLSPKIDEDPKQTDAVIRGLKNNLIISGGPGTGKTTVVYDILKNILKKLRDVDEENLDSWNVYLTAPTGKAKDRLKESIIERIESDSMFTDELIKDKLKEAEPKTIHSLLKYSPTTNGFAYNKDNQFPEKSIFMIDEASMIDICLFGSLLNAIPDKAIVFILGDKDQLPSVDAGAVLGDFIGDENNCPDYVVKFTKSHRQDEDSIIPEAAAYINTGDSNHFLEIAKKYIINRKHFDSILTPKLESFRDKKKKANSYSFEKANEIFNLTKEFKILCAERKGPCGVEEINKLVVGKLFDHTYNPNKYFAGELLMITSNNKLLGLSNGDNGVVVKFEGDEDDNLWFMIKKNEPDSENVREGIFSKYNYTYYPLYLIPSDSIEVSYAMTIHKSQGSGYTDIIVFLPEKSGHPLLNRQILYTAITRAKKSFSIVASDDTIREAIENKISRDTMILI